MVIAVLGSIPRGSFTIEVSFNKEREEMKMSKARHIAKSNGYGINKKGTVYRVYARKELHVPFNQKTTVETFHNQADAVAWIRK